MARYRHRTTISFGTDGEADYSEHDVEVSYTVAWGDPGTGSPYFGPVELYDPGSPDEVEDIHLEAVDGVTPALAGVHATFEALILDEVERTCIQDMLAAAAEVEDAKAA